MRILVAHNYYRDRAGEDRVVENEIALLRSYAHEVETFTADNRTITGPMGSVSASFRASYSHRIKKTFSRHLERFAPDVVHVHNFFPLLSPAVHMASGEAGVPVVQTLHNYRLVCPSATLFRDGKACKDCVGRSYAWPSIVHRCYRGSAIGSWSVANMLWLHRQFRTWERHVGRFVALTAAQRDILVEGGLPADRIAVKPNFAPVKPIEGDPGLGSYMLFAGRLTVEKGIARLLDIYQDRSFDIPLLIAGDGPMRPEVERAAAERADGMVRYVGHVDQERMTQLIDGARFVVFPSIWAESFGMGVVEAMARGKPTMVGESAAMADVVNREGAGWILEGAKPSDWARQLQAVWADTEEIRRRGGRCRVLHERDYAPGANYSQLLEIYAKARQEQAVRS